MKAAFLRASVVLALAAGCSEEYTPVSLENTEETRGLVGAVDPKEEEVFGRVWHNGQPVNGSSPRFFVRLEPDLEKDPNYWGRLDSLFGLTQSEIDNIQAVDPSRPNLNWGWYFPAQENGGPCIEGHVGNVEKHRIDINGQLVLSQSGPERHCATTGRFVVSLLDALESVIATREIDFISASSGSGPAVEDTLFGPAGFTDNVVHFDPTDPSPFPTTIWPMIDSIPAGFVGGVIEFDASNTMTSWNKDMLNNRGQVSVRWFWDINDPASIPSSYMNTRVSSTTGVKRTHKYSQGGTKIAEAQFINPAGVTETRQVSVTVGFFDPACATITFGPRAILPGGLIEIEIKFRFDCSESSSGSAIEHMWDFGDGETTTWMSGPMEVTHDYVGPATFIAELEAREMTNPNNGDTEQYTIVIEEEPSEPVATVTVSPSSTTVEEGESDQLTATTKDAQGNVLTGRTITWTKNNSNITLSPSGQNATITGVTAGSTTVTATSEGVSGNSSVTITTPAPPVNDATAGGNSFPSSLQQAVFYAVSANMTNSGNTTWSDAGGYSFRKKSPWGAEWLPMSVSLGSSVAPGQPKTFMFNLYSEAASGQSYNLEYQMYQNGTWFGDVSSKNIFILASAFCMTCGSYALDDAELGALVPGGAVWGNVTSSTQSDTLQVLVVEDYPLKFEQEGGSDVAHIKYMGSLVEKWEADVTFRITFDHKAVSYGQTQKGVNLPDYEVEVENEGPGVVKINLNRLGVNAGLPEGEELLLDIPIVGNPGKALPATLEKVEVIVTR